MSAERSAEPSLAERLAGVPEIDLDRALHHLNGQQPAVERVLRRVAAEYAGGVPDLLAPLGQADAGPEAARRTARACHGLRGVLTLLGAEALARDAAGLEKDAAEIPDGDRRARAAALDAAVRALAGRLAERLDERPRPTAASRSA